MKRFFMILILVAAAAFGMYAAYHYYHDDYLPEQEQKQDIQKTMTLFEQVRPEIEIPNQDDIPVPEAEPLTEAPRPDENPIIGLISGFLGSTEETEPLSEEMIVQPDTTPEEELPEILDISALPEMISHDSSPLESAQNLNSDMVAWLNIPGTEIDYPIVQGEDNAFYLDHALDGSSSKLGVPFLDYRCESDFSGFTSVVYAHNMEWVLLFARIFSFKQPAFMRTHPYGWLTIGNETHRIDFIAYLLTPDGSGVYEFAFITEQDRIDYLNYIKRYTVHSMNMPPQEELAENHLLLLSTCTFEYQNARGLLVGIIR